MVNTGTWNSDFAIMFLIVFFSPLVLYFLAGVFLKILEIQSLNYTNDNLHVEPVEFITPKSVTTPKPARKPAIKPSKRFNDNPDDTMYSEAVEGLVGLGYKKSEARRIISKACNKKDYKNAEDIISDVISSVY